MEKSKFFSMKSKKKDKEETTSVQEPSFSKEELDSLLATVEESMDDLRKAEEATVEVVPVTVKEIEVKAPSTRKAYNIWQDPDTRMYMLDTVEYKGNEVISVTSKKLTLSQPMAMYEIKRIFTDKLILKRGGM